MAILKCIEILGTVNNLSFCVLSVSVRTLDVIYDHVYSILANYQISQLHHT